MVIDSPAVLEAFFFRMLVAALVGWLDQRQQDAVAYLIEENRVLRWHFRVRLRFTDDERRRLAATDTGWAVAVFVMWRPPSRPTPFFAGIDNSIARKWTYAKKRGGRPGLVAEVQCLVVCMAEETVGYTRMVGVPKNVGHRSAGPRSLAFFSSRFGFAARSMTTKFTGSHRRSSRARHERQERMQQSQSHHLVNSPIVSRQTR